MSGLWGLYSAASFNPMLLPWAERTLRGAEFLFGMDTFRQLAEVSVLLRNEDAFVARARDDVGFRAFAAAISVPPPEWLDAWTLRELLAALPFHDTVRQWITLFQSGATYWSTSDTSAWHVSRLFDFYALRNAGAMWWEMPRRGAYHDVFARMEAYAVSLGVELRRCAPVHRLVPRGDVVEVDWGYEGGHERFGYAVAALDIPNAKKVLRHPDSWPETPATRDFFKKLDGLRTSQVVVVRAWFENRIRAPRRFSPHIGCFGAQDVGCPFDFIFVCSRFEELCAAADGEVLEYNLAMGNLHAGKSHDQLMDEVLLWTYRFFPELEGGVRFQVIHDVGNFSRSPAGCRAHQPAVDFGVPNVFVCGDWVRYDAPVAYMEKAFVTGLAAANCILAREGRPQHAIRPLDPPTNVQEAACRITRRLDAELAPPRPGVAG